MKLIREKVFETNSSSAHSISLASESGKQFLFDTIYPDQHGIIYLYGEEFGWDWFKHNDALTKAQYAMIASKNNHSFRNDLLEVIKEQTGATEVICYDDDGYIDHDSDSVCPQTKDQLKDFIFNKNSWLFGGNDNSSAAPEFYHVPEYKDGKMIQPEFKFELAIDGFDEKTKFLSYPTNDEIITSITSLLDEVRYKNGIFDTDTSILSQIRRDKSWLHYDEYRLAPDIVNQVIYFIPSDMYYTSDTSLTYPERVKYEREFYLKHSQSVKFKIYEITKR